MTPLGVLVCEDSGVYAAALRRTLEYDGDIKVLAVATTAEEALAALPRLTPDLVTMDLELPGMDGLRAVEEIMGSHPMPILVLSSHVGPRSAKTGVALAAGALEALPKADLDLRDPAGMAGAVFRHRIRTLSRARVIRHPRARLGIRPRAPVTGRRASVVGICASVGGPPLLMYLLAALPADYPIPVLIVQHMAAGFTEGLVQWLDQSVPLPVRLARRGIRAPSGASLAPDGAHLTIDAGGQLCLDRHGAPGAHRPSGDVLLTSIAAASAAGVAVVLTGMGSDGAAGAMAVRRSGGLAIAQDELSSAVFGMPKAARESGVDVMLPPAEIAACLRALHHQPLR